MADYIKTISNSINMFGLSPTSKWGASNGPGYTFVWGTTKWGEGSFSLVFDVRKLIDSSMTVDSTVMIETKKIITNDLTVSGDLSSEKLSIGIWDHVFKPNTTEGENRTFTSWSSGAHSVSTYVTQGAISTIWS